MSLSVVVPPEPAIEPEGQPDILDCHFIGPGGIPELLQAMDAVGISAVLLDEYWLACGLRNEPCHPLPGGGFRVLNPTAQLAAQLHPTRFSWLLRINRRDQEYRALIRMVRDAPGGRAIRLDPGMSPAEMRQWAEGGYDHILAAAADWNLPVFVFAPDLPEGFARAAQAFPSLRIGIDHCGVLSNGMRATIGGGAALLDEAAQTALFERVCRLSERPNLALKWGQPSTMFDKPAWPGEGLWPLLQRAVSAFGAERVIWESDYATNRRGESWADLLYGVRGCPQLTKAELASVLGGALRTWIDWPKP